MNKISYTDKAKANIATTYAFLLGYLEVEKVNSTMIRMADEIQRIADNRLISGVRVERLPDVYRKWMILDRRYWVYFKRSSTGINVQRIWPTRQPPLTPNEIRP